MTTSTSARRLGDDLLDARGMDAAVGDQLGQRQAGDLAADGVEAADMTTPGGVVDDHVDAGRLLEGADVAALAADDPALHLVAGMWTTVTVCSAVWAAATRCIAVTMTSRAFSWASSRARRSIARASLTASCSASSRTASRRIALGLLGGQAGDPLERGDLLLAEPGELLALLSRSRSRSPILRLASSSMSARWSSCSSRASSRRSRFGARRACPGLVLGLALEAELLVLRLEDHVLLLGPGLGHDPGGLLLGGLDRLARPDAAGDEPHGDADDGGDQRPRRRREFHLRFLPSGGVSRRRRCAYQVRATPHRRSLGLGTGEAADEAPPALSRCHGSPGGGPRVRVRLSP